MNYTALPEPDRYLGNHQKGEIEITDAPGAPLPVEYADKYIAVVNDRVRFPDGKSGRYLRIFHQSQFSGKHGTVMLARKEGVYVLIRIFRHTTPPAALLWYWRCLQKLNPDYTIGCGTHFNGAFTEPALLEVDLPGTINPFCDPVPATGAHQLDLKWCDELREKLRKVISPF